ncbi:ATP-binding cassette domain-containing protein [bacterium]|nr:ATP-binding cassette domain-containing protein [bacterium]
METILRVEHVTKAYDERIAVSDLSFEVFRGEVFGLLGPNGAGKTTTIRMIIDMIRPDHGSIYFGNHQRLPIEKIGYLPEERGLYKKSKVRETLVYFASLKNVPAKDSEKRADFWLERFQLQTYAAQRCEELSKGLQQKIQFIATLIHEPELLILDEPFSGLDPVNQLFIRELIDELTRKGQTILLSAHQMDHIEKMCERICMIHRGGMVLYGRIHDIKDQYDDRQVRIQCAPAEKDKLLSLLDNAAVTPSGIEGHLPAQKSFSLLLKEVGERAEVQKVERVRPTLEQIFIEKVKL